MKSATVPQGTRRAMRLSFQCINSTSNSSLLRDPAPWSPQQSNPTESNRILPAWIWSPIFAFQRPSCASWSPSCPSYSTPWRQHVQKCAEKSDLRANIAQDITQDASIIPSNHPKPLKNLEKPKVFSRVFAIQPMCPNHKKMLPKPLQDLPS